MACSLRDGTSSLRVLLMRAHLALDFVNGALLAASPWLFGFRDRGVIPYVVLGVMELLVTLSTRTTPGWDTARSATSIRTAAAGGRRS